MGNRYLKNYVACKNHFDDICFDSDNKLKKGSLPTLNLPGMQ